MTAGELRRLRLSAGWTQDQMAHKLGLSRGGYSRYERGERRVPKLVELAVRYLLRTR